MFGSSEFESYWPYIQRELDASFLRPVKGGVLRSTYVREIMKTKTLRLGLMLLPLICAIAVPAQAQTASPQQVLNQYVANLQSNPSDTALRGKIIALAQSMSPPPETPAEARRHMARGVAAVEDAKTPGDFKDACKEFQQAATLAPWLANAYRNLAIAQDKAGMYNESLASLRLYLLTKPSSSDVDWAEDLKAKVGYRKEKAAKAKQEESSPQAVAAREQQSFEDLLRKIDGRRYIVDDDAISKMDVFTRVIDIKGTLFVRGQSGKPGSGAQGQGYWETQRIGIQGRVTSYSESLTGPTSLNETYTISEDGDRIVIHSKYSGAENKEYDRVFRWQR